MVLTNTSSDRETDASSAGDLPLFRPEAIAAQQQKFYGDIILIQPFSLTFLTVLAVVLVSAAFGVILFAHHTQVAPVFGILPAGNSWNDRGSLANLYVPARALPFVHVGEKLTIRCSACTPNRQRAIVQQVSTSPLSPAKIASETGIRSEQPLYRITVALRRSNPLQSRAEIESELPLKRQPILRWLFERPAS